MQGLIYTKLVNYYNINYNNNYIVIIYMCVLICMHINDKNLTQKLNIIKLNHL